jgi:hypothetical protein
MSIVIEIAERGTFEIGTDLGSDDGSRKTEEDN